MDYVQVFRRRFELIKSACLRPLYFLPKPFHLLSLFNCKLSCASDLILMFNYHGVYFDEINTGLSRFFPA